MPIILQDFANGDVSYVSKLNSNNDVLEGAVASLETQVTGIGGAAISLGSTLEALFGPTAAIVGKASYAPSTSGTDLLVDGGFFWRPSTATLVSHTGTTTLHFVGLAANTYYIQIGSTGDPTRSTTSAEATYSVVWTGSAFGAITRVCAIVFGAQDWVDAQDSVTLGTFESLDERLEAIETTVGGLGDVVGPGSAVNNHLVLFDGTTGKLIKDGGVAPTGTNTGDQSSVPGNAGTATALQTARTIGGVSFNGTADITQPFDVMGFYPGIPTASAKVMRVPIARAVTFAANFAGSYFSASANATATTVFDVQKNGSSIGSVSIAAGGTTATFTTTSGTVKTFAAGDVLAVIGSGTPDATLADPGFCLAGTR